MINYDLNLLDDFHKRLLTLINSIDMTVKEIAKKIKVSESTIRDSWIARGKYPTSDKIVELLDSSKKYSA